MLRGMSGAICWGPRIHENKKRPCSARLLKACEMPGEVASLTRDHVIDWVNRYGKAWQEQSVKGILELFTDAGTKRRNLSSTVT